MHCQSPPIAVEPHTPLLQDRLVKGVTDRRLAARNVAAVTKAGAVRLGFDPSAFGGHSLRSGFVTSAVKRGANLIKITDVTGHRSLEMLKTYSRDAEAFVGHAGAGLTPVGTPQDYINAPEAFADGICQIDTDHIGERACPNGEAATRASYCRFR
jgi:hypothetical protein